MKKGLLLIVISLLLCNMIQITALELGDVNDDGRISIVDILMMEQYWIGLNPGGFNLEAADVNQDGKFSFADIISAYNYLLFGTLPVPGKSDTTPGTGLISFESDPYQPHLVNQDFYTYIYLNTGSQRFAAIDFTINYNPSILKFVSAEFAPNLAAYATTQQTGTPMKLRLRAGILGSGTPSARLHIGTIKWKASGSIQSCRLLNDISITEFIDYTTATIGNPAGSDGTIRIIGAKFGDINNDGVVTILDALILAQYNPTQIFPLPCEDRVADVSNDGTINIIDALMIAQYSVGVITQFPVEKFTPAPVQKIS